MDYIQRIDIEKYFHIKKTKAVDVLNDLIQDEQLERIKDGSKVFYQRKRYIKSTKLKQVSTLTIYI